MVFTLSLKGKVSQHSVNGTPYAKLCTHKASNILLVQWEKNDGAADLIIDLEVPNGSPPQEIVMKENGRAYSSNLIGEKITVGRRDKQDKKLSSEFILSISNWS